MNFKECVTIKSMCDINECDSNSCQNGGTCHNGNNQYTCSCLPGWTGTNCEIDIDECASTPCMYGNDCIQDRINSYICVCSERFEGVYCERGLLHDFSEIKKTIILSKQ
uniref:Versican core protein n=1 Tax=Magallana gigas TaxID=29159 RepID=K1RUJ1_MAGGI